MKKFNNKILIIVIGGLAAIFAFAKLIRSPQLESNFDKSVLNLDSASVTEIQITPAGTQKPFKLTLTGKQWVLEKESQKYSLDTNIMKAALTKLSQLKIERVVSRKKEKWEELGVNDKTGQLAIFYGQEQKAKLFIGKAGGAPANPYGGGGSEFTYVRVNGQPETYAIAVLLDSVFYQDFNRWRDKSFLRIPSAGMQKIVFSYPADSSFVLEKKDSLWYIGDKIADMAKVNFYSSQLSYKNLNGFDNEFKAGTPDATIKVEGAQGGLLGLIEGWKRDSVSWVLRSSLQKGALFSVNNTTAKELLVGKAHFLKK